MLLFIIGAMFVVAAIVFLVIWCVDRYNNGSWNANDVNASISAICGVIGFIFLLIVGTGALITNTPMAHESARIKYNARVEELTNTREAISHIADDYARSVSITQYNSLVREFKEEIHMVQIRLNNPWINWLNNYAYKDFDANAIDYITTFSN